KNLQCFTDFLFRINDVFFSALRTNRFPVFIKFQPVTIGTHPTNPARWIPHPQLVRLYLFGDHSTSSYKAIFPDFITTYNGGISPDSCSSPNYGFLVLPPPIDRTSGVDDIGKDHRRPQKYFILADDTRINRHIVLHLYPV